MAGIRLNDDIRYLKGVGEKRAQLFHRLGVFTVRDLLYHLPRDYEDRSQVKMISSLADGETVCICATITQHVQSFRARRGMNITRTVVSDGSGMVKITWFQSPYIAARLHQGEEYVFYGKVVFRGAVAEMVNPLVDRADSKGKMTGRIVPVYPATAGLTQKNIREAVEYAIANLSEQMPQIVPEDVREKHGLLISSEAMRNIHLPSDFEMFHRARRSLVFEELLVLQLGISMMKEEKQKCTAQALADVKCVAEFAAGLPFELTKAQKRAINEICADLKKDIPMNRLVQGDVGSGKTAVAAAVMFAAAKCGFQSAMMAPTEILAEQHYRNLCELFRSWNIEVAFLSGGQKAKERTEMLERIRSGQASIVVGTHALLTDKVEFSSLVLSITDEQHRFGVRQRAGLSDKGLNVHTLVMTATPIPRTLSLILYGDLDISIIDERPPGRQPIDTLAVSDALRQRVHTFISKQVGEGRQVYIVCPLVEESEVMEAKSAVEYAEKLKNEIFPQLRVGVLHGRMKAKEKEAVMQEFSDGNIDILVTTTVVEVGVDVPNATVMVIENAERFGLSQLHQLRGRVGRGKHKSYCILFCNSRGEVAMERMKVMCETEDGFRIAEKDLELRGPGEFFGTRQHGLPEMKIANFFTDMEVLQETQTAAAELLESDAELSETKNKNLKNAVLREMERVGGRGILS